MVNLIFLSIFFYFFKVYIITAFKKLKARITDYK
jgi:hypothetical protein